MSGSSPRRRWGASGARGVACGLLVAAGVGAPGAAAPIEYWDRQRIGANYFNEVPTREWFEAAAAANIRLFGCSLGWSFSDQRQRCPVCLQRLAMPVTIGSWASVFDPAITEFMCEEGHGSLSVAETYADEPDRWTSLDASWQELFTAGPR